MNTNLQFTGERHLDVSIFENKRVNMDTSHFLRQLLFLLLN
jgi:hypothetical protein